MYKMALIDRLEDFFKLVDNGTVRSTFKAWARMKAELIRASPLTKQIVSTFSVAVLISCLGMVLLSLWRHRSSVGATLIFIASIPVLWIRSEGSWIGAAWVFIQHFPVEIYRNYRFVQEHDNDGDPMSRMALLPKKYWWKLNPMNLFRKQVKKKRKTGAPIHLVQNAVATSTVTIAAVEAAKMVTETEGEPVINYGKVIPVADMSAIPTLDISEKLAEMENAMSE